MIRRPPRSTLFPYTNALPILAGILDHRKLPALTPHTITDPEEFRHELRRVRRSEEHTSELQSRRDLVCRLLLEKKKSAEPTSGSRRAGPPGMHCPTTNTSTTS